MPHGLKMEPLLDRMRDLVLRHAEGLQFVTAVESLSLGVLRQPLVPEFFFSDPMVCVVLQGAKQVLVGGRLLRYDPSHSFASVIGLPATGCVLEAAPDKPYVAIGMSLDRTILAELVLAAPRGTRPQRAAGFGVATVSPGLLEALNSFLSLLDYPEDIPALAKGREREVAYRLLQSEHGPMLRQAIHVEGQFSKIHQVIAWMRQDLDQHLSGEDLARRAGMSVPSFHRHFKAATAMSPLQYRKTLRLHEARKLLITNADAAKTAYAVGYESPSQFSREYSRLFGTSPARDAARLRGVEVDGLGR
uniref:Transcriptional regulator, AraC family n=1 Tax=Caulobacter sp. (strain K31) TaxID=366602 RepID=B0T5I6_CAUSK